MSQSGPAPRAYLGETAEGTFDYGLESMAVKGALLVQMDAEGEQIVIAITADERVLTTPAMDRLLATDG